MSEAMREAMQVLRDNIRADDGNVERLGLRDNDLTRSAIKTLLDNEAALSGAQQMPATGMIPACEQLPEMSTPVIGFSPDWIDADFNERGLRECFTYGDPANPSWHSARWLDEQDCYMTGEDAPTHWFPMVPHSGAQQGEAIGWRNAKDGEHWPHIGGKYLIKLNGVLQHEVYEFDQGDDGMGGGEYFWDRDDLDEGAPFNPEKDEWLPIDEAGMPAEPQPAQVPEEAKEAVTQAIAEALGDAMDCTRVWSAWGIGTMGPGDFVEIAGDSERLNEIAEAAIDAMLTAAPSGDAKPVQGQSWEDGYEDAVEAISRPANSILMTLSREDIQLDGDYAGAAIIADFLEKLDRLLKKSGARFNEDCDALVFDHSGDAKREAEIKAEAILEAVDYSKAKTAVNRGPGTLSEPRVLEYAFSLLGGKSGTFGTRDDLAARLRQSDSGDDSEGVEA